MRTAAKLGLAGLVILALGALVLVMRMFGVLLREPDTPPE